MSKDWEEDFDVDSIVIEDVDIKDIEDRNQMLFREDEEVAGQEQQTETADPKTEAEHAAAAKESAAVRSEGVRKPEEKPEAAFRGSEKEPEAADRQSEEEPEAAVRKSEEKPEETGREPEEEPEAAVHETETDTDHEVSDLSDRSYVRNLRTIGEEDDEDEDEDSLSEKYRPKRTKGDILRYSVMFVALCVFVYSIFSLVSIFMEYKAGEEEYKKAQQYVHSSDENQPSGEVEYADQQEPLNPNFQPASIDWDKLMQQNADIYGWIQFETLEQINYPIVHSGDNDYYLHHTIYHTENSAGSIFIEANNRTDFSDMNTFIYGHNMKNGSMFGLLRYYKEESYYKGNEYFWIYTPQGNYRYKIFSCYEPRAESETYTWWSAPCDEYTQYLQKVISYSKYSTGVTVKPTDRSSPCPPAPAGGAITVLWCTPSWCTVP